MSKLSFDNSQINSPLSLSIIDHNILGDYISHKYKYKNNPPLWSNWAWLFFLSFIYCFQAAQGLGMVYWTAFAVAFLTLAANRMEEDLVKNDHDNNTRPEFTPLVYWPWNKTFKVRFSNHVGINELTQPVKP